MRSDFTTPGTVMTIMFSLATAAFAEPRPITAIVQDPQSRPIPGAVVTVRCRKASMNCQTDANGRCAIQFPKDGPETCHAAVESRGFSRFLAEVDATQAEIRAGLELAPLHESVEVKAEGNKADDAEWKSVNSASFSRTELERISNDPTTQLRFAKLAAGALSGADAMYVDGMPATALPPAGMVDRIDVNLDPFSAEFFDGDMNRIEITTRRLERRFRFSLGGGGIGAGGGNILAPGLKSESHSGSLRFSGPIPRLPLTFALNTSLGLNENDQPIVATLPTPTTPAGSPIPQKVTAHSRTASTRAELDYPGKGQSRAHFSYLRLNAKNFNGSAGGVTLPEAAVNSSSDSQEMRATLSRRFGRLAYRGGLAINDSASTITGNTSGPQYTVPGSFVGGGSPVERDASSRQNWTLKNVFESAESSVWSTGIIVSRSRETRQTTPNPQGRFEFPDLNSYTAFLNGTGTGFWYGTRGNGLISYSQIRVSPFVQHQIFRSAHFAIRGGLRADYQSHQGLQVSPLVAGVIQYRGFTIRAGGGLFRREIPSSVFIRSIQFDGTHLTDYVTPGATLSTLPNPEPEPQLRLLTRLGPGLQPGRQLLQKYSLERRFTNFQPAVEFTSTREWHLTGSRRIANPGEWRDLVESNRRASRNRIHAQLRYRFRSQSFALHYDWIRSRDNTNGPFSFPEQQDNIAREWARTAGIPAHQVAFVASLSAPGRLSLSLTTAWHGSAPYDITTGADPDGLGLYNDRGGRERNSGNGPDYCSTSLYAHRRVTLPQSWSRRLRRNHLDLGFQADNLLQNRNYTNLGSVSGSSNFGRPVSALPGRSVRVWIDLE